VSDARPPRHPGDAIERKAAARVARADGLELFVRAAHAVCDALEARDVSGFYTAGLALCVARRRARVEEAALERAFDLPRRDAE
jgi:hypothetical protein